MAIDHHCYFLNRFKKKIYGLGRRDAKIIISDKKLKDKDSVAIII